MKSEKELIEAMYWLLSGIRGIHLGKDDVVREAMNILWQLAQAEDNNEDN